MQWGLSCDEHRSWRVLDDVPGRLEDGAMNARCWTRIGARVLLTGWVAAVLSVCVAAAPIFIPFPELVSSEGSMYAGVLHLDDYVEDSSAFDADLVWRVTESAALDVQLTRERHLIVRTQDEDG
jgi:hypothetical protein